ncbi:CAP domain-containing protein [Egicoccus sp. AB-alg2]|uniref:CAP domain-containing protein n=1 Tax=Egicoccus sp. AB-alg2 TaxID=3242693 RepID=UPI00359DC9A8
MPVLLRRMTVSLLAAALLAAPLTATSAAVAPAEAHAAAKNGCKVVAKPEAASRDFIAAQRKKAKVGAIKHAGDLRDVARDHAMRMCTRDRLYHNPNLTKEVRNWRSVGENVGRGTTIDRLNRAFMDSPGHRANVLDKRWTQYGVGVAVNGQGKVYVVQVYRRHR